MSAVIAAFIAHVTFWVLMVWGWAVDELSVRSRAMFLALWIAGYVALPYVPYGDGLFPPYVAILDVILVLMIFKSDVRIG